jgi:tetratricopeptide (TPR) repeat protein
MSMSVGCCLLLLATGNAAAADEERIPLFEGLGSYHREIRSPSPVAQSYFDQGMMLRYAFGRPEAVASFRAALTDDPECAICFWGEAWALGPYQNEGMSDEAGLEAWQAIQSALTARPGSEVERAMIEAMATRYAEDPEKAEREQLDRDYSKAMRGLAGRYPDDPDIQTLFAESLMVLHPWDLYPDGEPRPEATEAIEVLEGVLAANPAHAGACHLYIHAVEPSTHPERGEACADRLAAELPKGSHIQHMPSHIYMRIGRYGDAVRANQAARLVDAMAAEGKAVAIYPTHNIYMLWYAGWMDGQSAVAIQAAHDLARARPKAAFAYPLALARFGRWDELIEMTEVPREPLQAGLWWFARGLAFLRTGREKDSRKAEKRLRKILDGTDPEETFGEDTTDGPAHLLRMAYGILAGERAAAAGDVDRAVRLLQDGVAAGDEMEYSEPETWPIPVRQVLGAVLLEAGRAAEAVEVYEAELARHPENGWSLFGLAESLRAVDDTAGAADADARFERAWARADVLLTSSRF